MDDIDSAFLTEAERLFLHTLNEFGVRYLIVGMSAALLQGARGATEDVDLWFESIGDPRIGEAARCAGGFWLTRTQPPMLGGAIGDRFDVVCTMSGLSSFETEYSSATTETIDGTPVKLLPLARILHSKKTASRTKDEPGVHQIETAIRVIRSLAEEE